ncbi:MAG: TatD DNase family protein [Candidatus Tokpelaia sp. JSC188]|nr:MAG: TatD DNase family protein [Candidatus Tokpelaia sp. JSC188]
MLIDSHCHLHFDEFLSDIDQAIERAIASDIEFMITVSTSVRDFPRIQTIVEKYENIFCSVGTHPHKVFEEADITTEDLLRLSKHPKVVAIGEVGLDYYYDNASSAAQKENFLNHIKASRQTELPLIIHSRNADDDIEKILRNEMKNGAFSFVLHCYSSGRKLAQTGIELGGYLSFSGILTFKNAVTIREIAKTIPYDRLLVETDAPYLAPIPYRGRRNEPSFVIKIVEELAKTLDITSEQAAKLTTQNALHLFKKMRKTIERKDA